MKIKMLVSMAGADHSYRPGEVIDVSDETAISWVEAELAVIYRDEFESASMQTPETTSKKFNRKGR